jgi:hypothetical protein
MADQKYIATIELEDHIDAGRILKRAMAHLLESDRDRRCGFEMALLSKAYRDVQYPPRTSGSAQPRCCSESFTGNGNSRRVLLLGIRKDEIGKDKS